MSAIQYEGLTTPRRSASDMLQQLFWCRLNAFPHTCVCRLTSPASDLAPLAFSITAKRPREVRCGGWVGPCHHECNLGGFGCGQTIAASPSKAGTQTATNVQCIPKLKTRSD